MPPSKDKLNLSFEDFLTENNIHGEALLVAEPERWAVLKELYDTVHPKSFVTQKLFILNKLRHRYPLPEVP